VADHVGSDPADRSTGFGSLIDPSVHQTALVTGASSGIGASTVVAMRSRGFEVHAVARREDRLLQLAETTGCIAHVLDVRDTQSMCELASSTRADILVNNAGLGRAFGSLASAEIDDIDRTIDTNVTAAIHAARAVLPSMIEAGRGHIVNIGSMAGLYPLSAALYGASKGAVHLLSTNLRLELQGTGIRVTEICPGRVNTEFYDVAYDSADAAARVKNSGVDEVTSEDVAAAIMYAVDAPWRVNINRIELQPTEQTYGGSQFVKRASR